MRVNIKKFLKNVQFHLGIFCRGLAQTLYGLLNACLVGIAIYGFILVGSEGGYAAVFDFIAVCILLMVAICNMFRLGLKSVVLKNEHS